MKAKQTYLKGKSVFTVSIIVIVVTILLVYFTGELTGRTVISNFYLSLSIIGTVLFLFMTYGLYYGVGIIDNFPKFQNFKTGNFISDSGTFPDLPSADVDGIEEIIVAILLWIGMTILFFILLIALEAVIWAFVFIVFAMLYWVFIRALRLVFSKSEATEGNLDTSAMFAFGYTTLYLGWIFALVYFTQQMP